MKLKESLFDYISRNKNRVKAFPPDSPAVYELYWTPSQVAARSHPNLLSTQKFLQSLWYSSDSASQLSTAHPLTYADRLRIRSPGDVKFTLGPHIDSGSLERWEDPEYAKVYERILQGDWESYDPYDAKHRINAKMDLYNGAGACSMFRCFQGWLSMSSTGPGEGTLRVCPMLREATAYLMLRPFFDPDSPQKLDFSTSFPGSIPGACQEYNGQTHPHLDLESTMVPVPNVEPGDYVAWHCDMIHSVEPEHRGQTDSSVLYIATCPMTAPSVEFLTRQRETALAYAPPPDYPDAGGKGESGLEGVTDWNSLSKDGMQAMGLGDVAWSTNKSMSSGERALIDTANQMCFAR